nr:MAG TPA: hypothetical protein [Caudoviricetes sp.]
MILKNFTFMSHNFYFHLQSLHFFSRLPNVLFIIAPRGGFHSRTQCYDKTWFSFSR